MELTGSLYDHPDIYDVMFPAGPAEEFYRRQAERAAGPVLELACGSGRYTVPVARDGHAVVGLDQSAPMLAAARARAEAAGVSVELVAGDMRELALERRFGLIFIATNSLLHLASNDELVRFFRGVRAHLLPTGRFAFDVFSPSVKLLARPHDERFTIGRYQHPRHGEILVEETVDWDVATQVNRVTWYISTPAARDAFVVPLHLRAIFPQELPLILQAGGLTLESRWGDFAAAPFDRTSRHQVCVCRADGD
jgi:SAM-dependent methyltransferase